MKKSKALIIVAVVVVAIIAVVAIMSGDSSDDYVAPIYNDFTTAASDSASEQNEEKPEWEKAYAEYFQNMLGSEGASINAVYIDDVDGDGVPMVAYSTTFAAHKMPNVVLSYKNGKIVENVYFNQSSGWSIVEQAYFCKGTDNVVFRAYGNTTGTLGYNEQAIMSITPAGEYDEVEKHEIEFPENYNEEIAKLQQQSSDFDFSKYNDYLVSELDKELKTYFGDNAELVEYAAVMKDFGEIGEDSNYAGITKEAMKYIDETLGLGLSF